MTASQRPCSTWLAIVTLLYYCCLVHGPAGTQAHPINLKSGTVATEFLVLHNNDMHARFEQQSVDSTKCTEEDAKANRCYGGFARVAHEVRRYRTEAQNGGMPVFYLNAGDTYTGTPWFTVFKDNITAAFLNKLEPDAISLGNHEFDEEVKGLVPFLNEVNFPVLACNLDLNRVPEMTTTKSLANSTVLEVKGVKIGVIGYLTPETKKLVAPNDVEFRDEIEAINEEAARLKSQGINIIIALGHSGYLRDQEIAAGCPEVDVVIGGHTNTFLYNGAQPDKENIDGPYPTVVKQKSGKEVPVVQAFAYTKYLGRLHMQFDEGGDLIEFDGSPILLDSSVESDEDVLQLLEVYRPNITALENNAVGHTKVFLEGSGSVCRFQECNLGNLIADSWVYARVLDDLGGAYWTDAPIAFIQGGGIRSSIAKRSDGIITEDDVITSLPFGNDLVITQITGKTIRNALERSASLLDKDSNGGFLQMSGVHVVYDYSKDEGKRVESVEVRCSECDVPKYEELNDTHTYSVITTSFLVTGGDGHTFVEPGVNVTKLLRLQKNEKEAFIQYLGHHEYVYPEIEGRIEIKSGVAMIVGNSMLVMLLAAFRFGQ